jgi:hypothetical protein
MPVRDCLTEETVLDGEALIIDLLKFLKVILNALVIDWRQLLFPSETIKMITAGLVLRRLPRRFAPRNDTVGLFTNNRC